MDGRPLQSDGWRVKPSVLLDVVPLTDGEAAWHRMEQNLRRLVERGRSHALALTVDEDFDAFYELHASTHARKGAPLYPFGARRVRAATTPGCLRQVSATYSMLGFRTGGWLRHSSYSSVIR